MLDKLNRMLVILGMFEDKELDGFIFYFVRKGVKLFVKEFIGVEYGEGFVIFRVIGFFYVDVDFLNDWMWEWGL